MPECTIIQPPVIANQLTIRGFMVSRWNKRKFQGFKQIHLWMKDEKLRYRETITEGFDNMFEAFVGMMRGNNFGKAIVKV